jgi:glucosylceramidase
VRTPYNGSPAAIPGRIESVNFDRGGSGVAYSDSTAGNSGGAYRPDENVDIEPGDGGFDVGWTAAGEYLDYMVNVGAAGSYLAQLRVASPSGGGVMHLGFDAPSSVWTAVSIPQTNGWQAWTTVSVPVTLASGGQTMTVAFDSGGFNLASITIVAATTPTPTQPTSVNVVLTTADGSNRLAAKPPVNFAAGNGSSSLPTIVVDDTVRYQQIDGFGGSITDAGAWMLAGIPANKQAEVMSALFDRNTGIGINFLRQPIGASDFARTAYTFDDITPTSTDFSLASFSIDHDRPYILPALRAAKAINPNIRVLASPWTAPAWMKNTRTLSDGGSLKPEAFATYASYLVRFVQDYQAAGIPIDALTVQNEPLTAPPYPSMYMTSDDQATFIGQHLGPALARASLRPKVFAWDHNWDTTYPFAVLSNSAAASYVSGVAFHCYGGDPSAMTSFHQAYPQLDIALTECADSSRVSFGEKLGYDLRSTIIGSLRNWARSVAKWNLILDETGGPKLYAGTCRNCLGMVTINSATGAVSYNEDYYAMGHASKFIQRGAYRVDSNTFPGGIENVAALNPDGSLVVLAVNSSDFPITFQIRSRGASVQYTLGAGSVATFSWAPR